MMTISAIRTDGSVYLYDEITNKTVNLAEQDYNFYSDVTDGLDDTRFRLLLDSNVLTGIDSPIGNKGSLVKAQNGGITVNAPAGSGIVVYSIEGVKVYETTANGAQAFVALPAGVYLVKVNAETVRILVY